LATRAFVAGLAILFAGAGAAAAETVPGTDALDYGFRFASAIDADPKDKARAQQAVVLDYATLGLLDEAVRRAESIDGWRRLVSLANLASRLARAGRVEDAQALVARVEADRRGTQGWEGPRVAAELASAYAALGNVGPSAAIARDLVEADARQYAGRSAAIEAGARGANGDLEQARAALRALDARGDVDTTWWRTMGYLDLSTEEKLDPAERRSMLDEARRSADELGGRPRVDALIRIAARYRERGVEDRSVDALDAAQKTVERLEATDESRPVALAEVARAWADAGQVERARRNLAGAETGVARAPDIDRPGLFALLGSAWHAVGDATQARRLYDRAFDGAVALQNARPRALAVVEVCRALGRERVMLDPAMRDRLDALFGGLKAPW
jgi:tetratricopeptide (TPR) repeat protein